MTSQISDIVKKQEKEAEERENLKCTVESLQQQVTDLERRLNESEQTTSSGGDHQVIFNELLPLVQESLAEKIEYNTAEVKTYNAQATAKANYCQSLINEIKSLEKDVMLYGYRPQPGDVSLEEDIQLHLFKNAMGIENLSCKATVIGAPRNDRPQAIRLSFVSLEARNAALGKASKLPRKVSLEKCMPRRYRNKNREFKSYAWQLKQVDKSLVTRIIFKGHKLTLEMKQKDLEETK